MNVVLAVGNSIMGDDGIGLVMLERLQAERPDADVLYVDGGTGGLGLLDYVGEASKLLVLDAVAGNAPGEVRRLTGDQVPRMLTTKLSPHQVGLLDIFAAAKLLGREPEVIEIVGVVPGSVDLKVGLSEAALAGIPEAVALAADVIDGWKRVKS